MRPIPAKKSTTGAEVLPFWIVSRMAATVPSPVVPSAIKRLWAGHLRRECFRSITRELRREPQDFHFRPALHRGFGPAHHLSGYCVREVILAAVLAHLSRHLLQDHRGVAALKGHCHLSGAGLTVFAYHAIHCSLRFPNPGSHCSGWGSYAVTIMHVPVPASQATTT